MCLDGLQSENDANGERAHAEDKGTRREKLNDLGFKRKDSDLELQESGHE